MSGVRLWERYKALQVSVPAVGLTLDVSRSAFPDDFLASLERQASPWFAAMKALEAGAIANPDEKRMVGHYWLRAPELAPTDEIRGEITGALDQIRKFAAAIHAGTIAPPDAPAFKNLLVIGIGGSALGPQFVTDALGTSSDRMKVFFSDNTDPDGLDRTFEQIAGAEGGFAATLTIVISKSGGTKETRNAMLEAAVAYSRQNLEFPHHAVAVTGAGSDLDAVARSQKWLDVFPMWDWVGGRTSELSAVGLLPAALQGIDIDGLLRGARLMDEATRIASVTGNAAALLAAAWHFEGQGKGLRDMVVLPYKDRLLLLSRYLQQLVMESLGKEKNLKGETVHQGLAVYGNKGSTDQHAYVQQLRDGIHNFFVTFIGVMKDRDGDAVAVDPGVTSGDYLLGFRLGTRAALHDSGRGSVMITVPDVSPASIGALIALFERAVGLYASMVGINAYHQPGVEAGKKAAGRVLEIQAKVTAEMKGKAPRTAQALAEACDLSDDVETVYHILEHLAANAGRGVRKTEGPGPFEALYSA